MKYIPAKLKDSAYALITKEQNVMALKLGRKVTQSECIEMGAAALREKILAESPGLAEFLDE